jgi:hypothetical protein
MLGIPSCVALQGWHLYATWKSLRVTSMAAWQTRGATWEYIHAVLVQPLNKECFGCQGSSTALCTRLHAQVNESWQEVATAHSQHMIRE